MEELEPQGSVQEGIALVRPLYVAFVGMKRAPSSMPDGYWPTFVRYHLELPWYYARYADCRVHLTTTEPVSYSESFDSGGTISTLTEGQFMDPFFKEDHHPYDVVVHWRKWFPELYFPGAKNVILSQDHSYSDEWKDTVRTAYRDGKLDGILVFPKWHHRQVLAETDLPASCLYQGLTLGVDVHTYRPGNKDPFHLLWASDPGRGLDRLIDPFLKLWNRDRRFKLSVTYPDYVQPSTIGPFSMFLRHPAVTHYPGLRNGPALWKLFNDSGFLPYSSTFPEPSSRCHRQAQAAGSVVLYPPGMGTPSDLIGDAGLVVDIDNWADLIMELAVFTPTNADGLTLIGQRARALAESESWEVQAKRFYEFFSEGK